MRLAEAQGVIVVAAAGQGPEGGAGKALVKAIHGQGVVYPAAFEAAIGVAASNIKGRPGRPPRGPEVDVTVPGEGVWNAKFLSRTADAEPTVAPGKGTSFSTAITAGVAAVWLDYHGRDALVAAYGRAAVPSSVQVVARHARLRHAAAAVREGAGAAPRLRGWHLPGLDRAVERAALRAGHAGRGQAAGGAAARLKAELCDFVRNGIGGRWKRTPADAADDLPGRLTEVRRPFTRGPSGDPDLGEQDLAGRRSRRRRRRRCHAGGEPVDGQDDEEVEARGLQQERDHGVEEVVPSAIGPALRAEKSGVPPTSR